MLSISTYIIVIIIAKIAYLTLDFLIIRHWLCTKIGEKGFNSEEIRDSQGIQYFSEAFIYSKIKEDARFSKNNPVLLCTFKYIIILF